MIFMKQKSLSMRLVLNKRRCIKTMISYKDDDKLNKHKCVAIAKMQVCWLE